MCACGLQLHGQNGNPLEHYLLCRLDLIQMEYTDSVSALLRRQKDVVIRDLMPYFSGLSGSVRLDVKSADSRIMVTANRPLLETLLNNLIVNAVRHSIPMAP